MSIPNYKNSVEANSITKERLIRAGCVHEGTFDHDLEKIESMIDIITEYKNISTAFDNNDNDLMLKSTSNIITFAVKYEIEITNNFLELNIPQILLKLAFGEHSFSKECVFNSINIIKHLIFQDNHDNKFYLNTFLSFGFIESIQTAMTAPNCEYISSVIKLLIIAAWKQKAGKEILKVPSLFQFVNFLINNNSSVVGYLYYNLLVDSLFLLYELSFYIENEEQALFFHNFCIFICQFPLDDNLKYNIWLVRNICMKFPAAAQNYFSDNSFTRMLQNFLVEDKTDYQIIEPTLDIIQSFVNNSFDCSLKFSFFLIIQLLSSEEQKIVNHVADFIAMNFNMSSISGLQNILDIRTTFKVAFDNFGFETRKSVSKALFTLIRESDSSFLQNLVKQGVVLLICPMLGLDDDEIVIEALNSLIKIWNIGLVFNEKGNNIAEDNFQQEGMSFISLINYKNKRIEESAAIFINLYEKCVEDRENVGFPDDDLSI